MGLLMPVAGLVKARYRGAKAEIDSPFFKLHYRTTATLLFMAMSSLSSKMDTVRPW